MHTPYPDHEFKRVQRQIQMYMLEQSKVMNQLLAYMTLFVSKHVVAAIISIYMTSKHMVAAILIGGGPITLLIRPTGFVTSETWTQNYGNEPDATRQQLTILSK